MSDKKDEIKPEILDLATKIKEGASVEAGIVTFDKDVFVSNLPEGLTAKVVKEVDQYKQQFGAAQALATGELGIPHMAENSDVSSVKSVVRLPVGVSAVEVLRSKDNRNPQTGEVTTVKGHANVKLMVKMPGNDYQKVRQRLYALAKDL